MYHKISSTLCPSISPFFLIHFLDSTMSLVWYMTCGDRKGILLFQYSKSFTIVFFHAVRVHKKRKKQCHDDTKSNIYILIVYMQICMCVFSYILSIIGSIVFFGLQVIHSYKKSVVSHKKKGGKNCIS